MRLWTITALACEVALAGCTRALNYPSPSGPRYVERVQSNAATTPDSVRLVTFNIEYARHIDSAIALLESAPRLAHADIITLQEMDLTGTDRIARALGMSFVYYPATVAPATGRDFGDAILSRWPITDDRKIILPHLARFEKTQRIATAATVRVGSVDLRVYSVHLGTAIDEGPGARRDQVRVVMADAAAYPLVIVSGDMNSHGIGNEFVAHGYGWPTRHNPRTEHIWNWDHIFLKGLTLCDSTATGVVRDNRHASDHHPVWAVISLLPTSSAARTPQRISGSPSFPDLWLIPQ